MSNRRAEGETGGTGAKEGRPGVQQEDDFEWDGLSRMAIWRINAP